MTHETHCERHRRSIEMIGHALVLQDAAAVWNNLAFVLEQRLTRVERAMLLVAVAKAAETDDAIQVLERLVADTQIGSPLPVLEEEAADARWWAGLASLPELRAWLAASYAQLPPREQQAFAAAVSRRCAA